MDFLIFADEPFKGTCQSVVVGGKVAYTGGLTVEEYAAREGRPVRVVPEAEFDRLMSDYIESRCSAPIEITAEQWNDALNVLPPSRWGTCRGVEMFHIVERVTADLVGWYGRIGDRFFCCNDRAGRPAEYMAGKFAAAL